MINSIEQDAKLRHETNLEFETKIPELRKKTAGVH